MDQIVEREQWANWKPAMDSTPLDSLLLKNQLYCVVQTAHAEAAIRSPDGNAWIRCIAFCNSLDSAYEIARSAHDKGDKMETRILQSGKCALVSKSKRVRGDLDKLLEDQKRANRRYDDHVKQRESVRQKPVEQSKETVNELHETDEMSNAEPGAGHKDIKTISTECNAGPCEPISMEFGKTSEVFMQRVFAIGVIEDTDEEYREPVVIPLCAAETMEELQELVKPLSNNVDLIHIDIFCGSTMEWMPLHKPKSSKTFHKHPLRQALEEKIKWIHHDSETARAESSDSAGALMGGGGSVEVESK
jgi:hypothetical protein